MDTSRISPTAHYTGYVWYANGLSCDALATPRGKQLYQLLTPMNAFYEQFTIGPSLNQMLLQRHMIIDHLLTQAIESGAVGQVIEVAAGLSPRGWRFKRQFRNNLVYIEGDLPEMAALKRSVLGEAGLMSPGHHVVELNALSDDGEQSIAGVGARLLDPSVGTAIISEGLLSYFEPKLVEGVWRRFAGLLRGMERGGLYLADLHLKSDTGRSLGGRVFRSALGAFARGAIHVPFEKTEQARTALMSAGFTDVDFKSPARLADELPLPVPMGWTRTRIVEARVELLPGVKGSSG